MEATPESIANEVLVFGERFNNIKEKVLGRIAELERKLYQVEAERDQLQAENEKLKLRIAETEEFKAMAKENGILM